MMRISVLGGLVAVTLVAACNGESAATATPVSDGLLAGWGPPIYGQQQTHIAAKVGQVVGLTLWTVGPGAFDSLPAISSSGLRFLDAAVVGPYVPAGPRQLFRFLATAPGRVIISFPHSGSLNEEAYHVVDTVDVH
jgi:hypothetical protein